MSQDAGGRPPQPATVEVVVVAYLSRDLVLTLLDRLAGELPVVVVDNARGRDGLAEAVAGRAGVRYLAGVGATTVGPDGAVELGVGGWEPTLARSLVHAVGAHRLAPTRGLYARPVPGRPLAVDWLSGACLAVPRKAFLALGGFDEHFFVYNEDMAYGRRVREAGLGLRLRTDVLVPHQGTGSGEARPLMFRVRGASMSQYLQRHQRPAALALTRAALTGGTGLRWVHARLRGRGDLAEAHAAYLTGLWRGAPDRS